MSLKVKKIKEFNYNTKVVVAVACRAVLLCYRQRKAGSTPAVTEGRDERRFPSVRQDKTGKSLFRLWLEISI